MRTLSVLLLISTFSTGPSLAINAKQAASDYQDFQKWMFTSAPIPLPASGIVIRRDTATWTLQSGSLRLMKPASDGTITGLVFEGTGRFRMTIPDRFELAQLRRFAGKPDLQEIDQTFTQLVMRVSDNSISRLLPAPAGSVTYAPNALAEKRHHYWLVEMHRDTDARIVTAMANSGALQIMADTKTADFDWLTFDYDSSRAEEVNLSRHRSTMPESWLSLDRTEDRQPNGRPGLATRAAAVLEHLDAKVDLTRYGRDGKVGIHNQRSIDGHYIVEERFGTLTEGIAALQLALAPTARDVKVFSEKGDALTVIRDHLGKRSIHLDNRFYDDDFVVLLPIPLKSGDKLVLRFEYDYETANYALGGAWYPTIPDSFEQRHTARLELTVAKKNEVRSMGRLDKRTVNGKTETSVWIVDKPAKMLTFSSATRFEEVKVDPGGIPPVISFGPSYESDNRDKVRNVGADVANSLQYFQVMLEDKVEADQFYVTSIAGGHGQAFDGFLHMAEYTYTGEHPGASELFRAHEVAHQWWGHKVGWKSYRDQWLSESLAEYSAMMFVQGFVKGGDKFFNEILDCNEGVVMGNFSGGFSKFARPWLIELDRSNRQRLGPIGHGRRAGTGEIPAGYQIQAYHKGPLVLHMLRTLLLYRTSSDVLFIRILRDSYMSTVEKRPARTTSAASWNVMPQATGASSSTRGSTAATFLPTAGSTT